MIFIIRQLVLYIIQELNKPFVFKKLYFSGFSTEVPRFWLQVLVLDNLKIARIQSNLSYFICDLEKH